MNGATTATHVGASTLATAALMVVLKVARVNWDNETLGYTIVLVNGATLALHPYALAIGSRLMTWLTPAPPVVSVPAPVPPAAPPA